MLFQIITFILLLSCWTFSSISQAATTDVVIRSWAEKKYEASGACQFDEFIQAATRKTQAIASQIYKNGSKNYNLINWISALKTCEDVDSSKCFVEADWVLHEEMSKTAPQFGCKQKDIRNLLIQSNCQSGFFKSSVTSFNGEKIQLCSVETKCRRSALFDEGSYNLKCRSTTSSCAIASLKICDIFRFEGNGWFNNKSIPAMNPESPSGAQ